MIDKPKPLDDECEDDREDEELEREPKEFDPREEWGTMPSLRGNGRGQL